MRDLGKVLLTVSLSKLAGGESVKMEVIERLGRTYRTLNKRATASLHQGEQNGHQQDAQNALKKLFIETIQEMLEAENTHLGYEKHEVKSRLTPNSRNGKSKKTVVSEYGEQEIAVPPGPAGRVRAGAR
ncbi:Transposase, Mutator family [compost metagenome]